MRLDARARGAVSKAVLASARYAPTRREVAALRRAVRREFTPAGRWRYTPENQLLMIIGGSPEQVYFVGVYQALRKRFVALAPPRT